jgi:hypothetical protein
MMARPFPWRADSLQALADTDTAVTTVWIAATVVAVILALAYWWVARFTPPRHDDAGTCLACEQERARGRRGL